MRTLSCLAYSILLGFFLSACTPTPEDAKAKLAKQNVPVDGNALLASTKAGKDDETAKLLTIAGADPNAVQANGMTVLMSAVFNNQEDVAKMLIEKGAKLDASAQGFNALSLAVERDNKSMIKILIKAGADPRVRPIGGMSALEKAQLINNHELVSLLEEK